MPFRQQSLQSILMAVDRLEKITENYLRLSKLSTGKKEVFDLGDSIESVLATYAPECEKARISVDWKRESSGTLQVHGDRDLLEQALGNLFRNAMQALQNSNTDRSPAINWRFGGLESGALFVCIEDNGPGIPKDIRPRLFTPFVTSRAEGTGLGLSFVKKVIEDHGGKIECKVTQIGAKFEIVLPSFAPDATKELPAFWRESELNNDVC